MSLFKRGVDNIPGPERKDSPAAIAGPASFEEQICDAVVVEGDVCYDVGANIQVPVGRFAMGKRAAPEGWSRNHRAAPR